MSKVILVEDASESQLIVSRALANTDIELTVTGSFQETKTSVQKSGAPFDLAILDLMLPDGDGFAVLEFLRQSGMPVDTPVFFLTSETELNTKLTAFHLGADDYLVKPISPVELRARVQMRLRKSSALNSDVIIKGDLIIEMSSMRGLRQDQGQQIDLGLTAKQLKILTFLVQNENKVFSRAELVEGVWGKDVHVLDRTVDSHVYGMRKKMGPLAHYVECILGAGYRFRLAPSTSTKSA